MTAPMHVLDVEIPAEWVDYNDHLNDAYHAVAFSRAGDAFMDARSGSVAEARAATGRTIYTLAWSFAISPKPSSASAWRSASRFSKSTRSGMRVWLEARRAGDGVMASTSEQVYMCVDRTGERPRAAEFPADVAARAGGGRRRPRRTADAARGWTGPDAAAALGEFGDAVDAATRRLRLARRFLAAVERAEAPQPRRGERRAFGVGLRSCG